MSIVNTNVYQIHTHTHTHTPNSEKGFFCTKDYGSKYIIISGLSLAQRLTK